MSNRQALKKIFFPGRQHSKAEILTAAVAKAAALQ